MRQVIHYLDGSIPLPEMSNSLSFINNNKIKGFDYIIKFMMESKGLISHFKGKNDINYVSDMNALFFSSPFWKNFFP